MAGAADDGPLAYVNLKSGSYSGTTKSDGTFEIAGSFPPGSVKLHIRWNSEVPNAKVAGKSTNLEVMDPGHASRSDDVTPRSQTVTGDTIDLGTVTVTSVDCQLWRYGVQVLERFHELVETPPPAGKLRIKRWNVDWGGVPYTYHDHIDISPGWVTGGGSVYTIFHEFGHSIFHVADGDIWHWQWDNFRRAYARNHSGCEIFNKQTAWNEGWGTYWRKTQYPTATAPDRCKHHRWTGGACQGGPYLEWNESEIGDRLKQLSDSVTPALVGMAGDQGPKTMVQVLVDNSGNIHSLWEFEQKFCQKMKGGSALCTAQGKPCRPKPKSCPRGYTDDGATCRITDIRAKKTYGRGVGRVPTDCGPGKELQAGLCYPRCRSGYKGVGPVCWQPCPSNFRDDGAFCAKPSPYGRGGGYALWDKGKCKRKHGSCEKWGLMYYPKCKPGYHNVACCICSPNCTAGMKDIGVSWAKKSYGRGVGTVPKECKGGMEYDAGLCYRPCRTGYSGVGPVCWASCPAGLTDHGATCFKPNIIVKY